MSKNEDYLDDLLHAVSGRNDKKDLADLLNSVHQDEVKATRERASKKHKEDFGREFYREFENELRDAAEDAFIQDFELELDAEEASATQEEPLLKAQTQEEDTVNSAMNADEEDSLSFFDGAEEAFSEFSEASDIGETAKEALSDKHTEEAFSSFGEETFGEEEMLDEGDSPFEDMASLSEAGEEPLGGGLQEDEERIIDESAFDAAEDEQDSDVDNLMTLLSGISGDEELSDIGALLKADEEDIEIENDSSGELEKLESIAELSDLKNGGKKQEKKKKDGFFSKLSALLFGDDEQENTSRAVAEEGTLNHISDENMEILKEIDASEGTGKKEKKKREKKEKPEKPEKPKKERVKKVKEKKEKKPKEVDLSPPLPKKPVILIAVMALSIFALIMLGEKLIGYSNNIAEAKNYYQLGNYTEAHATMAGMTIKESDQKFYDRCTTLSIVQEEYNAYVSLMDAGQNEMALDSLVRGIGRYDKYADRAKKYGVLMELDKIEGQIEQALSDQFGVSKDQALDLYGMSDREEYSKEIKATLDKLGLE